MTFPRHRRVTLLRQPTSASKTLASNQLLECRSSLSRLSILRDSFSEPSADKQIDLFAPHSRKHAGHKTSASETVKSAQLNTDCVPKFPIGNPIESKMKTTLDHALSIQPCHASEVGPKWTSCHRGSFHRSLSTCTWHESVTLAEPPPPPSFST